MTSSFTCIFFCFNTCATLPGEITVHPCHRPGRLKSINIHEHDAFCEKVLFIFNGDSVIKNASMKPHGLLTLKYLLQKQHKQCCVKIKIKCCTNKKAAHIKAISTEILWSTKAVIISLLHYLQYIGQNKKSETST